jgi:hypothetical protein
VPSSVKRLAIAAALLACSLAVAAPARADGDPAGDVLAQQPVFFGSALDLTSKEAAQLWRLVADAKAAGYEIRVAALSVQQDLGAIDYMWDDPINYAEFLAAELEYIYAGRTLVVMPSGYAVHWRGHSSARENQALEDVDAPGEDPAAVLPGIMRAVIDAARTHGVRLRIPDVEPTAEGVAQPVSHYAQASRGSAPAPNPRPARPSVGARGGDGSSWLYALPVLALVLAAGVAIVRARVRERKVLQ